MDACCRSCSARYSSSCRWPQGLTDSGAIVLATVIHIASALGAELLATGCLASDGHFIVIGGGLLLQATGLFIVASAVALRRAPAHSASVVNIRWALAWLSLTVHLGALMERAARRFDAEVGAATRGGWYDLVGWSWLLVAGTAYPVVPMFQLTPASPQRFSRSLARLVSASLAIGAVVDTVWA